MNAGFGSVALNSGADYMMRRGRRDAQSDETISAVISISLFELKLKLAKVCVITTQSLIF